MLSCSENLTEEGLIISEGLGEVRSTFVLIANKFRPSINCFGRNEAFLDET